LTLWFVLLPALLVTVRVTVKEPAELYVWMGLSWVDEYPSPKSHFQEVGFPVDLSVNCTVRGPLPEVGEPLKEAVGGMVATGLIVKVAAFDVPPPGVGLKTVTLAVPADAISEARMEAVSRVEERYVVVLACPFHWTVELDSKLLPVTVRVKAEPPAVVEEGEIPDNDGAGLDGVLMVKVIDPEVPPPGVGLKTVTLAVPGDAMSEARMDAVSWVGET
jgi:hypothetical protein